MYQKIEQNFLKTNNIKWDYFRSNLEMSRYDCYGTSIVYSQLDHSHEFKLIHLRKFFTIMPTRVYFTEIIGDGLLYPHIDHNTKVVLNFYITSDNSKTIFYKLKNDETQPFKYKDKETENIYQPDDLIEIGSFHSNAGDAYLLDVSKIHAVQKTNNTTRQFISYQWQYHDYETILDDLQNCK